MSVTHRKTLARLDGETLVDEHRDLHGTRTLTATPVAGGVLITMTHSDGRHLRVVIPCR